MRLTARVDAARAQVPPKVVVRRPISHHLNRLVERVRIVEGGGVQRRAEAVLRRLATPEAREVTVNGRNDPPRTIAAPATAQAPGRVVVMLPAAPVPVPRVLAVAKPAIAPQVNHAEPARPTSPPAPRGSRSPSPPRRIRRCRRPSSSN